jgi:hypothetical protein
MKIELTFDEIQTIIDILDKGIDSMEDTIENWKIDDEFHPLRSEIRGLKELIEKLEDVKETQNN